MFSTNQTIDSSGGEKTLLFGMCSDKSPKDVKITIGAAIRATAGVPLN